MKKLVGLAVGLDIERVFHVLLCQDESVRAFQGVNVVTQSIELFYSVSYLNTSTFEIPFCEESAYKTMKV